MKKLLNYFSALEIGLFAASVLLIVSAFLIFDRTNYVALIAPIIGVASLILSAKANPAGQALMVVFSILYGIISYGFKYYGEMLTYLGMTLPMAVFALIAWLKNPFNGKKSEVAVGRLRHGEPLVMLTLTAGITVVFYFILAFFKTANLFFSTLSVFTSFLAVYLSFRRSAFFALAYAANDVVLIVLWTLAAIKDISYLSVIICFIVFLVNDLYGFYSWRKLRKRQQS